jgi:hypothetical protein
LERLSERSITLRRASPEPEEFVPPKELDGRFRVKALKRVNGMTEEARMDVERVVQRIMRESRVPFEDTIREAVENLSK